MARTPRKKQELSEADKKKWEPKKVLMMNTEQALALVNHLSHARDQLDEEDQRKFDNGPLGAILKRLK